MLSINTKRQHFIAAEKRYVDVVKVLIQNGADVNAVTKTKWTALHLAAKYGHGDTAQVLLENGADVNAVNLYEQTPLTVAASRNVPISSFILLWCWNQRECNQIRWDYFTWTHQ